MKTRQATLVEAGRFEIQDAEIDLPSDHILVKMAGCGLCTWELNHFAGRIGTPPMALGHEGYGVVADIGKDVKRFAIGDRVTGLSAKHFADYFTLPEKHSMKIVPAEQREIPGEPLYCVQNVLRAARPDIGDTVVVVGCGPMGLWAIQGLSAPQLKNLVAVDIDERKLKLAESFGATAVINPKSQDAASALLKINDARLADVAVEGTGGAAGVQTAIDLLRPRRPRLVIMSSFKGKTEIDLPTLCGKAIDVVHAHPGITADIDDGVRRTEILINNRVFRTDGIISHRYPLEKIMDAFRDLGSRPDGYLKGIVTP
ncbi:MAG: zinc-binding dehydrogenase [Planctomycetota bacterium]